MKPTTILVEGHASSSLRPNHIDLEDGDQAFSTPPKSGSSPFSHGLAFLAILGFIVGFFVARIFTTLSPHTVIVSGGIHFHHFWYGLALVVVAGWLGIVSVLPTHRRIVALIFGLGGGLIGDEVGLLLTFGNYYSQLTYEVGLGIIGVASLCLLFFSYRIRLREDVIELGHGERLLHLGVLVAGMSVLAFAFDALLLGASTLIIGLGVGTVGWQVHKRHMDPE